MTRLISILALFIMVSACTTQDPAIARETLEAASDPAGAKPNVLDNALHAAHLSGTTPLACAKCHDMAKPEFEIPLVAKCVDCHEENKVALHNDEMECSQCHAFGAGDDTDKSECQRCHEEAQGKALAITAHAKVDCRNCHNPHGKPALQVSGCLDCHEDHQQGHGDKSLATIERCTQCHPAHTKSIEAVARCESCHKKKLVRAVFRGHNKCDTCHQNDRRAAPEKPVKCLSCHEGRITLASATVEKHAKCENCHAPHDPVGTAVQSCRRCHEDVLPKHPVAPKLGSCLGCHDPHPKDQKIVVTQCSSCHDQAQADDSLHAPKKTKCSDCHDAHEFKPVAACSSCHQRQATLASSAWEHKQCDRCHAEPHAPKTLLATCGDCHLSEYNTAPSKHRECETCHEPHSGRRLAKARCENCHQEQGDTQHGRIDGGCENCHRAHGPGGKARPPACTTCHTPSKLPSLHAVDDHQECETCHQGHGQPELNRRTCLDSCHKQQLEHERVAKTCVGCHSFGVNR